MGGMYEYLTRRHHCRMCGLLICDDCSEKLTLSDKSRVCKLIKITEHEIPIGCRKGEACKTIYNILLHEAKCKKCNGAGKTGRVFKTACKKCKGRGWDIESQEAKYILYLDKANRHG